MEFDKYKIADLLPHAPPMVLIDEVIEWKKKYAVTAVNITQNSLLYVNGKGVPAHVGLEYMAQSCGVYSGLYFKENNLPIHMGFLLGTRNYHCGIEWFQPGDRLIVNIAEVLRQDAMGVFDCRISLNNQDIASAQLTVYQSNDTSTK